METSISKWGNSAAVRIPKDILLQSGLKEDSPVEIRAEEGRVILSQPKRIKFTIEELMADMTPQALRESMSGSDWEFWQTDFGNEIIKE